MTASKIFNAKITNNAFTLNGPETVEDVKNSAFRFVASTLTASLTTVQKTTLLQEAGTKFVRIVASHPVHAHKA
jgi:hypothetical protein